MALLNLPGRLPPPLQLPVEPGPPNPTPTGGSPQGLRPRAREMLMAPAPSRIASVSLVSQELTALPTRISDEASRDNSPGCPLREDHPKLFSRAPSAPTAASPIPVCPHKGFIFLTNEFAIKKEEESVEMGLSSGWWLD